jgi:hypothetical protein
MDIPSTFVVGSDALVGRSPRTLDGAPRPEVAPWCDGTDVAHTVRSIGAYAGTLRDTVMGWLVPTELVRATRRASTQKPGCAGLAPRR